MQSVLLAAGKGTRLALITETRTKGMLPILGKPILERILDDLLATGLKDFIFVVNPADHELKEYFHRITSPSVNIQFIDQAKQLGTADALQQAAPLIKEEFVLSACDNLVPRSEFEKLISTWSQHPNIHGLLSLERIPLKDTVKTGIVTLEGEQVTAIVEKPAPEESPSNISSTPLYIFTPQILDYLPQVPLSPRGEFELQDAIQKMINDGYILRGLFLQNRLTLTTTEDLLKINMHFLYNRIEGSRIDTDNIGPGTKLVEPVYIEAGVEIGSDCVIGPGVYIEKNASIGDGVRLENAVVLREAHIPKKAKIRNQIVTNEC